MGSPDWATSALFLTYDEAARLYNHVPPPGPPPDDIEPETGTQLGRFDWLGIRVPLYLISPYARAGYVLHVVNSHTLDPALRRGSLSPAGAHRARRQLAGALDLFDFSAPPRLSPPPFEDPPLDDRGLADCQQLYPTGGI